MVLEKVKKKLFIKTWGCQMNVYDSVRMADVLAPLGFEACDLPDEADLIIMNTCHIREKAAEKLYSELGRYRKMKNRREEEGGSMMLAVAGCVAQAEGEEILRRAPYVDMVFGPQTYHNLPDMVAKAKRKAGFVNLDFPTESKFDNLPMVDKVEGSSAFLSVQEGCDKFCSFCVVPYTRGAEFSRDVAQILEEAKQLLEKGVREITLLGQNVNALYGMGLDGKRWSLARLIYALAELDGLERLRYVTSHPRDMDEELIKAHGEIDILMPYLHLPIQSGSDTILKKMNRKHTSDQYRRVIESLREARPDMAVSGDFIVGFPGETDEDFAETLRLVTDINYAQAYSFKYSERPGTPAADMKNQVPEDVKQERLEALQQLLRAQQMAFNESKVGKILPVLFDRKGKREGQLLGRSPFLQSVYAPASEHGLTRLFGQIVDVKITEAKGNGLVGEIVTREFDGLPVIRQNSNKAAVCG